VSNTGSRSTAFFYLIIEVLTDLSRSSFEKQVVPVLDHPFHDLALHELTGLGEGGREVDVPLFAGLAFDELDAGGEAHGDLRSILVI
jgi:hypothetical protein